MAAKNIENLLANLEEILEEGMGVPLSGGKRMVDIDAARDVIDEIRDNLPNEITMARNIVRDKNKIIRDAKREAEGILQTAENRARTLVSREEVLVKAQEKAREITQEANQQAATLRRTITKYCDNMLQNTQERLQKSFGEIKTVRDNLKK
jgi:vacuolar-type H+-ATPase subunit H